MTAPAGWYADPAGTDTVRYWDGNQWTSQLRRSREYWAKFWPAFWVYFAISAAVSAIFPPALILAALIEVTVYTLSRRDRG